MQTRREIIRGGLGLAGIIAAGEAPAAVVKSMLSARKEIAAGSGDEPLSAKSYVQDGLVAMWDGIENAGWGVHDPNATVWKDLVGGIGDLSIDKTKWTECGVDFDGFALSKDIQPTFSALTIETSVDSFSQIINGTGIYVGGFVGWPNQSGTGNVSVGFWGDSIQSSSAYSKSNRLDSNEVPMHNISAVFTSATKTIYNDGEYKSMNGYGVSQPSGRFSIMGYYSISGNIVYIGKANVRNVRLYSSALTADEIAANYAVDKARFNLP